MKPRRLFFAVLLSLPLLLPAGSSAWVARMRDSFSALLQAAALHPSFLNLTGVVAGMALLPFSLIPMSVLCLLAAAAFPPALAWGVIMLGVSLNTALAWWLARTVAGARIERWLERRGGQLAQLRRSAREAGLKWAILCRYVPAPFIVQPMVLASAGTGLGTTVLGTAIGMLPWSLVYLWMARAGKEGSLQHLGLAGAVLALIYAIKLWLRLRVEAPPLPPPGPLRPRREDAPRLLLYTVPDHTPSDEARAELVRLRDSLDFEVEEHSLGEGADPALRRAYEDHAPVLVMDGERLFNFQMDENVLRVRLERRRREGVA